VAEVAAQEFHLLFLMNDVVLTLDTRAMSLPLEAQRFRSLSLAFVIELGQELFAADPLLPHNSREKAERLALLLSAKQADLNAALFVAPAAGCAPADVATRFCGLSFDVMAALHSRQSEGALNPVTADREVWRRMAA
jgi:hypothetical protein